jgi:signal transduction histidine kinase
VKNRALIFFLFFSTTYLLKAQNAQIKSKIDFFEATSDHKKAVEVIGQLLKDSVLNSHDKLELQMALTHQFQNLQWWDSCIKYCQQQLLIAQQRNDRFAEASFYKAIGNTYYHIPIKEKAFEYWNKCISISEPLHFEAMLESCYHNVGVIYLEQGKSDLAEKYFLLALGKGLVNHPTISVEVVQHKRLLATCYDIHKKKLNKSELLYLEIIEDCKTLKDTAQLAEAMLFYTHVLIQKKQFDKAIAISAEALVYCRKQNLVDGINTALQTHAQNLFAAGKFKEAYVIKNELNELYKTRYSNDLNKNIGEAEAKFKNAEVKHEQQLTQVKSKKEKQIYLLVFGSLFCVTSLLFYYLFQKRIAKQKAALQQERIQSVLDGEEKERSRIAKDLHDGIVQDLTAIKMQLNTSLQKDEINKIKLEAIVNEIDKASKEVRNISYQMMPTTLRELGFFPAIEDLFKRVLTPSNIDFEIEQIGLENRLSENVEVNLFRITQELLNNVLKHSEASFVCLLLHKKTDAIHLIFEDNGKGFAINNITKGIGLNSLSSRVELLHGNIQYEKSDGAGTIAIVKIPV